MENCNNFTYTASHYLINHCLDKCIRNIDDDDYNDDYNKGARGAEALANDCYCKCIYNNLKDNNDTTDSNSNVFIIFFVIILFLLIFCAYGIMKVKIQQLYMNTNEINNITAITATTASNTIIDLEANNINYYTIDNSQQLPKYNDIEPNISLPPKYDNTIKSNYTNELM